MSKLILEFGYSSCYLEGLSCGTTCIKEDVKNEFGNFSSINSIHNNMGKLKCHK